MKPIASYRSVILVAVFVVASGLLGYLKIPAPVPSIALDSAPGYFIAGYLGPLAGGVVGALGHLASALTAGFPMGWLHLVVALQMFLWCFAFGALIRVINRTWAILIAIPTAIFLNGVFAPWMLGIIGLLDMKIAKGLVPFLVFASAVNAVAAGLAIWVFARSRVPGR